MNSVTILWLGFMFIPDSITFEEELWNPHFENAKVNYHKTKVCLYLKGQEKCVSRDKAPGSPDEINKLFSLVHTMVDVDDIKHKKPRSEEIHNPRGGKRLQAVNGRLPYIIYLPNINSDENHPRPTIKTTSDSTFTVKPTRKKKKKSEEEKKVKDKNDSENDNKEKESENKEQDGNDDKHDNKEEQQSKEEEENHDKNDYKEEKESKEEEKNYDEHDNKEEQQSKEEQENDDKHDNKEEKESKIEEENYDKNDNKEEKESKEEEENFDKHDNKHEKASKEEKIHPIFEFKSVERDIYHVEKNEESDSYYDTLNLKDKFYSVRDRKSYGEARNVGRSKILHKDNDLHRYKKKLKFKKFKALSGKKKAHKTVYINNYN